MTELSIAYDRENDTVTINDIVFSGEFFRCFAMPDPSKLYRFEARGDGTVTITEA